jgi:hypothetical protein
MNRDKKKKVSMERWSGFVLRNLCTSSVAVRVTGNSPSALASSRALPRKLIDGMYVDDRTASMLSLRL